MSRRSFSFYAYLLILTMVALVPTAHAQAAPANDNYADAMPIHATSTVTVNDVEHATVEGAYGHDCHPGGTNAGVYSVWFVFATPAGFVTLDTAGTVYNASGSTSNDTVISLYHSSGATHTCLNNPGSTETLGAQVAAGIYYVQVSAVTGTTATLPSVVVLTFDYETDQYVSPHDHVAKAKKLKLPANPTIVGFGAGTVELDEAVPTCAPNDTDSHSYWYKLTLTRPRTLLLQPVYGNVGVGIDSSYSDDLVFALYNKTSGLPQASDEVTCGINYIQAIDLAAGSYYLRISSGLAGGSTSPAAVSFYTVAGLNHNLGFEVSDEVTDTNDPLLAPWKVKNGSGDGVVCGISDPFVAGDCAFRFVNGPGENSTLKLTSNLTDLKVKKGDIFLGTIGYISTVVPDVAVTVKFVYTNGKSTKRDYQFQQGAEGQSLALNQEALTGKLKKVVLTVKNKTTLGTIDVATGLIAVARLGTAAREPLPPPQASPLPLPAAPN